MQTMFLLYLIMISWFNTPLRTVIQTSATTNTGFANLISFAGDMAATNGIVLSENRIDAKIEILNFSIRNLKHNPR